MMHFVCTFPTMHAFKCSKKRISFENLEVTSKKVNIAVTLKDLYVNLTLMVQHQITSTINYDVNWICKCKILIAMWY